MDWQRILRWIVPVAILVPWLALLTTRQVALFPPADQPPVPLPFAVTAGVAVGAVAALVLRWVRPTAATHVLALAVLTCGVSLAAAQIGEPLANATDDYCGDFCRNAILGRFLSFFGWPVVTAVALAGVARFEAAEWSSWTWPWATVTLLAGLAVAVAWWRIILPNG